MKSSTRLRLGELLLAHGVCSREQLREAWEQKVLYGDRLGTNLLALGCVDEAMLARALGEQHGVHSGYGKVITPDPAALKLIPKAVAERRFVVPHHVADKQLYLLMRDPHDAIAIDEVRFACALKVVPVVVIEARIWQLLETHYGARLSFRPVPLDGPPPRPGALSDEVTGAGALGPELTSEEDFERLYAGMHSGMPSGEAAGAVGVAPVATAAPPPTATLSDVGPTSDSLPPVIGKRLDKTGELKLPAALEVQRLQAQQQQPAPTQPAQGAQQAGAQGVQGVQGVQGAPTKRVERVEHAPPARDDDFERITGGDDDDDPKQLNDLTSPGRPMAILARRDPEGQQGMLAPPRPMSPLDPEAGQWRDTIEKTNPMLARPAFAPDSASDLGGEPLALVEVVEPTVSGLQPPLSRVPTSDFHLSVDAAGAVIDESPLSFADASEALKHAEDRDAIARLVLRAAKTRFERACLLTVFPDRLVGWLGIGEGMESERLRNVVVPRSEKSVFTLVVDSRAHYLGPLAKWPAHGAWVKVTGRKIPRSIAAFPILVRGRPVNVLVVDNGHDKHVGSDVGEVLILAQQIARVYETLLTQQQ